MSRNDARAERARLREEERINEEADAAADVTVAARQVVVQFARHTDGEGGQSYIQGHVEGPLWQASTLKAVPADVEFSDPVREGLERREQAARSEGADDGAANGEVKSYIDLSGWRAVHKGGSKSHYFVTLGPLADSMQQIKYTETPEGRRRVMGGAILALFVSYAFLLWWGSTPDDPYAPLLGEGWAREFLAVMVTVVLCSVYYLRKFHETTTANMLVLSCFDDSPCRSKGDAYHMGIALYSAVSEDKQYQEWGRSPPLTTEAVRIAARLVEGRREEAEARERKLMAQMTAIDVRARQAAKDELEPYLTHRHQHLGYDGRDYFVATIIVIITAAFTYLLSGGGG